MKKHIAIILVLLVSACTASQPVYNITIGDQIYAFSNDIRQSLNVPVSDKAKILSLFSENEEFTIAINGSSSTDNSYFTVVAFNTVNKLTTYFARNGRLVSFGFYDIANNTVAMPKPAIMLKGPNTGANETSVAYSDGVIIIQGTDYRNLSIASEKLVLLVMGVDKI